LNPKTCGRAVGCAETDSDWPEPEPSRMAFLIAAASSYVLYGGYIVARRRPRWLPLWLAAVVTWFTVCKYLICTRCERYGEACDFYYLGRWAAKLFEPQPDRTLDTAGIVAEGGSVLVIQFLPLLAAAGRWRMMLFYLLLLGLGEYAQISVCCSKCVAYSRDEWKADVCPSYRLARKFYQRRV
jgi:hypothetical protein